MTAGIGIFSPERGAKGIYPSKGHGIDFGLELSADRKPGPATEKITGKGIRTVKLSAVQGGNGEHLAGALAIRGGDNRGMDLKKPMVSKKLMDCQAKRTAQTAHSPERIGPWPQVADRAQKLETVPLFLQRIGSRIGRPQNSDLFCL